MEKQTKKLNKATRRKREKREEIRRKVILFAVKTLIYIILALIIWHISTSRTRQTEKDVGEK
jgi:hypothetical protein